MAKKVLMANLGKFTDAQINLLKRFKDILTILPDNANISLNTDSTETQNVTAQQEEDLGLTISLTTPLGTLTFSIGLDLSLTDLLNLLLDLITPLLCAALPDLNICQEETPAP
ncbi:hypothetical protein [Priestia endophytica]|uniref:hypothetical protein n=1 Tax=Priestia endophytica TaxID=135735 RepID=UPI00227E656E|nr:hypothetical protein [Priestia endophytica]MCY8233779.1 hypothetical protein [Priestia endophytica]